MEDALEKRGRVQHSAFTQRRHITAGSIDHAAVVSTAFSLVEAFHHSLICSFTALSRTPLEPFFYEILSFS